MDLVFELQQVADTQEACKSVLFEAKRYLLDEPNLAETIFVVARARVPVLNLVSHPLTGESHSIFYVSRLHDPDYADFVGCGTPMLICVPGHFNVDITVNGTDGTAATPLVKKYLDSMPAVRPLVMLIKALLEQHGLHSAQSSGLSSYCVICMVISFLQVRSSHSVSIYGLSSSNVGGQVNPMQRSQNWIENPIASKSFGWLFLDFLEYYGVEPPVPEKPAEEQQVPSEDAETRIQADLPPVANEASSSTQNTVAKQTLPVAGPSRVLTSTKSNGATEDEVIFDASKGFPYITHYISVREGKLLLKREKGWLRDKPWENGRLSIECLVNKGQCTSTPPSRIIVYQLLLTGSTVPDNDIAKSAEKIKAVRKLFRESRDKLMCATLEGTGYNVLSSILGVTQEVRHCSL